MADRYVAVCENGECHLRDAQADRLLAVVSDSRRDSGDGEELAALLNRLQADSDELARIKKHAEETKRAKDFHESLGGA